jgi:hypothetical protein
MLVNLITERILKLYHGPGDREWNGLNLEPQCAWIATHRQSTQAPRELRAKGRGTAMAMGPTCPSCKREMYKKVSEQRQPKGSWIVYECSNNGCSNYIKSGRRVREKVFEERS